MAIVGPAPKGRLARRIGGWLPSDRNKIKAHVKDIVEKAKEARLPRVQPIKDLHHLIFGNAQVYMLFNQMLTEVHHHFVVIYDVETLLMAINYQIQQPIAYDDTLQIGTPINAILDFPMATKAGFTAFLRDDVNKCFQAILSHWGHFLQSPNSAASVTTADWNWLSTQAQNDPNSPGLRNFLATYQVPDPTNLTTYGFTSWDQFFTRKFLPNLRPVDSPVDSSVICSAAESTPFNIQENVQEYDTFWSKDQSYSIANMLGDTKMAKHFIGGTVYQAFLSADNYHNWHAPVSGKYLKPPKIIWGTYYSEPLDWGFSPDGPPPHHIDIAADARSQGYISCLAKRGVAYIQPDDASLGLIAVVMIGMAEVSSIEFDNLDHFDKGQEIGRFHFGGSTHCLIFSPGMKFEPVSDAAILDPSHDNLNEKVIPVCSKLGTLTPKQTNDTQK